MDHRKLQRLTLFTEPSLRTCLWLFIAIVFSAPSYGEIYQWRDENGRVHFGDRPPEHAETTKIEAATAPVIDKLRITIRHQDFRLPGGLHEQTLQHIRDIYGYYRQEFGLDMKGTAEVNLFLFNEQSEFRQWLEARTGNSSPHYAGVFVPATNEVAVWRWSNDDDIASTILHEASHVLLFQLSPAAPVWLHEGLAQYFQTLKTENGNKVLYPLPQAAENLEKWVDNGTLITLRRYLSMSDAQWRKQAHQLDAIPYTVAWATTAFFLSRPSRQTVLRQLLHGLEKTDDYPTLERIDQLYPGGLARMEYDFFRWAQRGMRPQAFGDPEPLTDTPASTSAETAPPTGADY